MGVYAAVKGMLRRKLESMNKRPNEFGRFGRFLFNCFVKQRLSLYAQTFRHHAICLKFNGIVERGQFERIAATVKRPVR